MQLEKLSDAQVVSLELATGIPPIFYEIDADDKIVVHPFHGCTSLFVVDSSSCRDQDVR